jgi:hypothetical protein
VPPNSLRNRHRAILLGLVVATATVSLAAAPPHHVRRHPRLPLTMKWICPPWRPTSPATGTTDYYADAQMVVTRDQLVFDACQMASIIDPHRNLLGVPGEPPNDVEERARTMVQEAHFLTVCPYQANSDDARESDPDFTDEHDWGCGPYPSPSPTPYMHTWKPDVDYTCKLYPKRPVPKPSRGNGVSHTPFSAHPPIEASGLVYDYCISAYELSEASLDPSDSNVLSSVYDENDTLWETRFQNLFTEVMLYEKCYIPNTNGRTGVPPDEGDPNFTKARLFGCGPYNKKPPKLLGVE